MKAYRQVSNDGTAGEFISLKWASDRAAEAIEMAVTIGDQMVITEDKEKRKRLNTMLKDAVSRIVTATQISAALMGEEDVARGIFGSIPVEVVDVDPEEEHKMRFKTVYSEIDKIMEDDEDQS